MTDQQIVAAAAAWLDIRHPNWHTHIDLNSFNIHHHESCIGGQIGVPWGTLTSNLIEDHPLRQSRHLWNAFAIRTDLWKHQIRRRTRQPQPVS